MMVNPAISKPKMQMVRPRRTVVGVGLALAAWGFTSARAGTVSFSRDLAPILADKCLTCHQESKAKGKYRVDSFEALLKPGDSKDKPVTPGQIQASLLFQRLISKDEDERMPQKDDPLPPTQVELFKQWISQGAPYDGPDPKTSLSELLAARKKPASPEKYPRPLPITALALSADGARLYTSGYHEVLEWEASQGRLLRRIGGMPERVLAIDLARDQPWIAVAGGTPGRSGEVLIVDREGGKVLHSLFHGKDTVLAARFNPDASLLALGGTDNTVRMFRTSDFKQVWKKEAHADWVTTLVFTEDGKRLASTSRDRTARVFDAEKGRIEHTYNGHQSAVTCAAFSPDGNWLFTGAVDGEIRHWFSGEGTLEEKDASGKKKKTEELLKSTRLEVTALQLADDKLIASLADGRLRAYNAEKPATPVDLESLAFGGRVSSMTQDGEHSRLFCAGQNGEVHVLDFKENKPLLRFIAVP